MSERTPKANGHEKRDTEIVQSFIEVLQWLITTAQTSLINRVDAPTRQLIERCQVALAEYDDTHNKGYLQ